VKLVLHPVERLSDFQYRCLALVANRNDKTFVCFSGEDTDPESDQRNVTFNEFLQLIELGFFLEMDRENEEYVNMQQRMEQRGMQFVMAEMTNRGQWMWEQTPWEKWVN
jgi:hypothetical protein